MSTWLPIVILIVVVLSAGLLRERLRVSGIERWAKAKGFVRTPSPFTPAADAPPAILAARFHPRGARIWGVALEGMIDASPCCVAEYAVTRVGTRSADDWFTLAWWPSTRATGAPEAWPHEGKLLREESQAGLQLPGTMTVARLDQIVKLVPEARRRSGATLISS